MSATFRLPKYVSALGPVCPPDNGRYALSGICFKVSETGEVVAAATDGRILVEVDLPKATDIGGAICGIVDPKLLKSALTSCHSRKRDPVARLTEDGLFLEGNGASMKVPLIEGTYPDYTDVFPSDTSTVETTNLSIDLSPVLLARCLTALWKACGGTKDSDPRTTFAFHGPKLPVRIDSTSLEQRGRAVIMPFHPEKK